jgi:hypothetical protein
MRVEPITNIALPQLVNRPSLPQAKRGIMLRFARAITGGCCRKKSPHIAHGVPGEVANVAPLENLGSTEALRHSMQNCPLAPIPLAPLVRHARSVATPVAPTSRSGGRVRRQAPLPPDRPPPYATAVETPAFYPFWGEPPPSYDSLNVDAQPFSPAGNTTTGQTREWW